MALVGTRHGQAGEHHHGDWVICQTLADALGGLLWAHRTHHQGVKAQHFVPVQCIPM
ncbi:MAG: hypothetical protein NTW02_09470 [Cyanobium sp. LacPavin_0920_WC12_MAG_62_9]|nr:hypothetical protein [Cyanobium sp. LacPavin_0920_WC12_MAG_62_9]